MDITKAEWMDVVAGLGPLLSRYTVRVGALFNFRLMKEETLFSPDIIGVGKEMGQNGEILLSVTISKKVSPILLEGLCDVNLTGPVFLILIIEQKNPDLISSARTEESGVLLLHTYSIRDTQDRVTFKFVAEPGTKL